MNCRVGRVLRRLEVGEELQRGDVYVDPYRKNLNRVKEPWWGETFGPAFQPILRPLTPEEVEDYKRRMEK